MRAIITGASKGIGWSITQKLVSKGYDVAICSRSSQDLASCKADLLKLNSSSEVITKTTDLKQKQDVKSFAHKIKQRWGHVDVLINNAGTFLPGKISEEDEGTLETLISTNLYSAYHLTREILPIMLPQKSGNIINMCSIASIMAYPNGGSYSISKFALLGFSKVIREELKPTGIKVTSVLPGATWSDSWKGSDLPYDRLIETKEIAEVVYNILSLGSSAVVEEIIIRPQKGDI